MPKENLLRAPLGSEAHVELLVVLEEEGAAPPGLFVIQSASAKVRKQSAVRLAKAMGKRVYQIGLAALTSEYIGETEKALAAIFDRAEASGAVLFFDEADALFGAAKTRDTAMSEVLRGQLDQRETPVIAGTVKTRSPGVYWKKHARVVLDEGARR